jgi:hypothetical protein
MENKTAKPALPLGRYVKYAIGEIVLVVIGILIALQINNWNESRKNHSLEQAYMNSMHDDIQKDIDFIKRNIIDRHERKIAALEMGKAYYQGTYKIKDTLSFLNEIGYGGVYGRIIWGFEKTTYNELINTGAFRIISNDSLRKAISNYYLTLNRVSEGSNNKETGYINFTNSKAPFDRKNPEYKSDFDQQFFLKSLHSEAFYELTNLEITLGNSVRFTAEDIIKRANELLRLIESQMK